MAKQVIYSDPEPEPVDQAHALRLVASYHRSTLKTLRSHQEGIGMVGGYGGLYMLIEQKGYFASLLTPELIKEGLNLVSEERELDIQCEMIVAQRYNLPQGQSRLIDKLEGYSPGVQDAVCSEKFDLLLTHPHSLALLEKQVAYEDRLIAHLKSQQ